MRYCIGDYGLGRVEGKASANAPVNASINQSTSPPVNQSDAGEDVGGQRTGLLTADD